MPTELSKTYDPASVEQEAYRVWLDEKCFAANPDAPGEPYCIVIPPPNVTGALHLGHAINNTLQDILTRVHRMRGFNTLWIPGVDHAGIATQAVVEKQLKEKENKTRHDVGRDELVKRIWAWKEQYGDRIIAQLKRLGCSCDWDRTRFTLDDMCARAVRETFFKLFKDGLIYRGKRLVNWDTHLQTSISDDEIYHETVKTSLWHIRYPIIEEEDLTTEHTETTEKYKEGISNLKSQISNPSSPSVSSVTSVTSVVKSSSSHPKFMTVATTRPETLLGDTAVAVHSEDPRWNWAIGKFVALPLTGRKIPIIADDILVDPKFGSGVVKVTPAHDPNDYAVWQRHQGKPDQIDLINILNPDGTLNENAGAYAGMKRNASRTKVVEDLTALGLLEKEEPYETQVGHSDRSKTPVEPFLSDQWFVKMAPLAEPALEVVRNGTIKFFPERHAQQYLAWLGEKRDWPISRQLWWGHRIPVWTVNLSNAVKEPLANLACNEIQGALDDLAKEIMLLDNSVEIRYCARLRESLTPGSAAAASLSHHGITPSYDAVYICPNCEAATGKLREVLQHLGKSVLGTQPFAATVPAWLPPIAEKVFLHHFIPRSEKEDEDVLDTWFSSALWPHSTLGWPEHTEFLKKYYPTSVLLTGRDIITLWVARMVMTGMYNMGTKQKGLSTETAERGGTAGNDPYQSGHFPNLADAPSQISLQSAREIGIPFLHVAINPTILDGKGERMSKSKGNGVDPVEIIDTHGADALRFTLTTMATETQDVRLPVKKDAQGRNSSDKFDSGRNFANKLWNAARFAISSLELIPPQPDTSDPGLRLADRWIISRFNRAVSETDAALAVYRFDQYAKVCYEFFWRDFCDWYVEAIKPDLKDPTKASPSATVLAAVLDGTLRLLHPMIPFITETIWWRLNEVRPQRGLAGYLNCSPSHRLVKAVWPKSVPPDSSAESNFENLQEIVIAIRNARNEYKADLKKILSVSILAPAAKASEIFANRTLIELLSNCHLKDARPDLASIPNAAVAAGAGCGIFIEDLADADADRQRSDKRREELTRQKSALQGRLSNAGYIAKAPPHLVEETKKQLAEAEAELAKLG
jgi:valyl-tRNA synthetase